MTSPSIYEADEEQQTELNDFGTRTTENNSTYRHDISDTDDEVVFDEDGEHTYEDTEHDGGVNDGDDDDHDDVEEKEKQKQQQVNEVKRLVQKEIHQVQLWRWLLYVTFVIACTGATVATYLFLVSENNNMSSGSIVTSSSSCLNKKDTTTTTLGCESDDDSNDHEERSWEEKMKAMIFDMQAHSIERTLRHQFNHTIEEVTSFSKYLTSYANHLSNTIQEQQQQQQDDDLDTTTTTSPASISSWPFVTLPGFASYASHILSNTNANRIFISPFVTTKDLWSWSSYSVINQDDVVTVGSNNTDNNNDSETMLEFVYSGIYQFDDDNNNGAENGSNNNDQNKNSIVKLTSDMLQSSLFPAAPIWQMYPIPNVNTVNFNVLSMATIQSMYTKMMKDKTYVVGNMILKRSNQGTTSSTNGNNSDWLPSEATTAKDEDTSSILTSIVMFPIFDQNEDFQRKNGTIVGMIIFEFDWFNILKQNLDEFLYSIQEEEEDESLSMVLLLNNTCGQSYSFDFVDGQVVHAEDEQKRRTTAAIVDHQGEDYYTFHLVGSEPIDEDDDDEEYRTSCMYSMSLYPSSTNTTKSSISSKDNVSAQQSEDEQTEGSSSNNHAKVIGPIVVALCFILVFIVFVMFDKHVRNKFQTLLSKAAESNRILSELFPSTVRDRLFNNNNNDPNGDEKVDILNSNENNNFDSFGASSGNKARRDLKKYLNGDTLSDDGASKSMEDGFFTDENDEEHHNQHHHHQPNNDAMLLNDAIVFKTKPIADLFPAVTIMFTDIVGFTAWSAQREPYQVFTLLETIYHSFDQIAKKKRVFKVETVGDSYVAVSGLPEPCEDHAIVMSRFATDCLKTIKIVTKKLEPILGNDTGNLTMRGGLHTGPVTAGVLRGERSRFQLFGDTMNTASRMESTGVKDRIQISQETADELISAGKVHWLTQRQDKVIAKGKGEVETYWLTIDTTQIIPDVEDLIVPPLRSTTSSSSNIILPSSSNISSTSSDPINNIATTSTSSIKQPLGKGSRRASASTSGMEHYVVPPTPSLSLEQPLAVKTMNMTGHSISSSSSSSPRKGGGSGGSSEKVKFLMGRFIESNVEVLLKQLRLIEAKRRLRQHQPTTTTTATKDEGVNESQASTTNGLDEVQDCISFLPIDTDWIKANYDVDDTNSSIELRNGVEEELREYVTRIAHLYRTNNSYHNFEYATYVTMNVHQVLTTFIADAAAAAAANNVDAEDSKAPIDIIRSDPLIHFTMLLGVLIHNVDHTGVQPVLLPTSNDNVNHSSTGSSSIERNSFRTAWNLLMEESNEFLLLRQAIYNNNTNSKEYTLFRQIVLNSVMATNVFDPTIQQVRYQRYEAVFSSSSSSTNNNNTNNNIHNEKATIIMEQIIQVSTVLYTMQQPSSSSSSLSLFRKWNERLFNETLVSYRKGYTESDPSRNWYQKQLEFFDTIIIPLAKQFQYTIQTMKPKPTTTTSTSTTTTTTTTISEDEYENNNYYTQAHMNRNEFAKHGQQIIEGMVQKFAK